MTLEAIYIITNNDLEKIEAKIIDFFFQFIAVATAATVLELKDRFEKMSKPKLFWKIHKKS